jgi:hypothetical protein
MKIINIPISGAPAEIWDVAETYLETDFLYGHSILINTLKQLNN